MCTIPWSSVSVICVPLNSSTAIAILGSIDQVFHQSTMVHKKFVVVPYMGVYFNQFSRDLTIKSSIYEYGLSAGKNNLHFCVTFEPNPFRVENSKDTGVIIDESLKAFWKVTNYLWLSGTKEHSDLLIPHIMHMFIYWFRSNRWSVQLCCGISQCSIGKTQHTSKFSSNWYK